MSDTSSEILVSNEHGVMTITINRLAQKNALSLAMYQQMTDALVTLEKSDDLHAAVITGSEECFTAGNDLHDFLKGGALTEAHPTVTFLRTLVSLSKPLIAAVAGPAIGIGTTMLMHCDLVYAANNSVLQLPFSKLGLCPEAGSSQILPAMTSRVKAFELLVLGERFDAQEAKQLNLVNKVVDPSEVLPVALASAKALAQLPSQSVKASKGLIVDGNKELINNVITHELKYFEHLLKSPESKQIISSFFSK